MTDKTYEVLTEEPSGHRMVHRVLAANVTAAQVKVEEILDPGVVVVEVGTGPLGLDSPP
jgi:hypothetical protein